MKTTLARALIICDACRSSSAGIGGYALIVGGTKKKVKGSASSIETMLHAPQVRRYYPKLSEVQKNERGASKGWTADFINTSAGYVFHFIGLDEGVAGANFDNIRPTLIVPDDIDDREDSPVISDSRFNTFTRAVLPTRQANTLVFFAQNLISRYSVMYRIYKQHARVLTNRLMTDPIPAVIGLETETRTVGGIVKDIVVAGTPTWPKGWTKERIQDEIDTYGLPAFLAESQHEVEESKEGLILHNYDDSVHVISESEFAAVFGSVSVWKTCNKWALNDWARTKTEKHANVAAFLALSSQNTALPGCHFLFHPMSFAANTEPEDVAEAFLNKLSPFAYQNVTWASLRKDALLRSNAEQYTNTLRERLEFERSTLATVIPKYSRPLLQKNAVRGGIMGHSDDTVKRIYNHVYGFSFTGVNPGKHGGLEEINRLQRVDYTAPHPFTFFLVPPTIKA